MIRVGIVGYGFAGRGFHAPLSAAVPGLAVSAVATRSPERRAQAEADLGVPTFETLEALLASGTVDLVVLATPHNTHAEQATAVMEAGVHVVIDKPMAITTREADQLLAVRDRTGVLMSVFHNRRWDWDFLTLQRAIAEGRLGVPYLFEVAVLRYKAPRGWRGSSETGGGLVYDWGAHLIDQALQLVPGPVADVSCEVQRRRWGSDAGSYVRLLLRFTSGVLYGVEIGNLAAINKPRWYVLGEDGGFIKYGLDPQEPALMAGDITQAEEKPEERAKIVTMVDGAPQEQVVESDRAYWTGYYENVRDAILGKAELAVRPEEARRVIAILEAAVRSAETHEPVTCD